MRIDLASKKLDGLRDNRDEKEKKLHHQPKDVIGNVLPCTISNVRVHVRVPVIAVSSLHGIRRTTLSS